MLLVSAYFLGCVRVVSVAVLLCFCRYELPVTLSANQNIILREVEPAWKEDIQATLEVSLGRLSSW